MAILFAKDSHNWSARASSHWTLTKGGTDYQTPAAGDVLLANGYTITVDDNLTAAELRNDITSGATSGGKFSCGTNGLTIAANIYGGSGSLTICFEFTLATPNAITILGNITGGSGAATAYGLVNTSTGTVDVGAEGSPANITGGSGAATSYAIHNASTGIINVIGNVVGGSGAATSYGVNSATSGSKVNVVGNVTGGNGTTTSHGISCAVGGTVTITGSAQVTGGSSSATGVSYGINGGSSTVNIGTEGSPGVITGGSGSTSCYGVALSSGRLNAYASVQGGSGTTLCYGVHISSTGIGNITGTLTASASSPAVASSTSGSIYWLNGPQICHANGVQAVNAQRWIFNFPTVPSGNYILTALDGVSETLAFLPTGAGWPAAADVRSGTAYAAGSLTGTLIVPPAASVAHGVPVDATTGTALLTGAAIWGTLTATLTTAGSIGERLANSATVSSTGAQLAAFESA